LIAYAQNHIPPTEESIIQNIEVVFPVFKQDTPTRKQSGSSLEMSMGGMSMSSAPTIADRLPPIEHMNIAALNQNPGGSLIPGMDQLLKQREVEKATEKMMNSTSSPWFLRPEDVEKYNNIFNYFNKSGTGVLSTEETKDAFMQTQLDEDVLEKIWGIVDTDELGEFDRKMF